MSRGHILKDIDPATRALSALGSSWDNVQYSLEPGTNGGFNPYGENCASTWKHPKKGTVTTSDCIGFVMWCLGADRYQPLKFKPWGGWINTDAILADIDKVEEWDMFQEVKGIPKPGDLIVYGSRKKVPWGRHPGHVGIIVAHSPCKHPFGDADRTWWHMLNVVHCHGPTLKGRAIHKTTAAAWAKRPDAKFVRFVP